MSQRKFRSQLGTASLAALLAGSSLIFNQTSTHAVPNNAPGRPFGDIVGLNVKFSQGQPQSDLPLLKELQVKWVRDSIDWPEIEPTAGHYVAFPAAFQERLKFYKENGIGVDFILGYENAKAYPATPDNPHNPINAEAFGRYAAAVAKLFKASGVRFVLEIWNEPHNFTIQKMVGGQWNGKAPSAWVDHYLQMADAAVKQVKAVDPQIKLLDDDDMWIIHYWYLEKGVPHDLDGYAFHPYWGESSGPEVTAVGQDTSWTRPFVVVDADRSLQSAVRRLREQGVLKTGKPPALWATELGDDIGNKTAYSTLTPDGKVTPEAVAAYVPRAFITAADAGVEAVMWFSSQDSVDGPMGLTENGGKQRPAYAAFKTMTAQLAPDTLVSHVMGSDHLTSGVQCYQFHGPQGDKWVLWDIDGEANFLANTQGNTKVSVTDTLGHDVPVHYTLAGHAQLSLSQSPIYVTGLPTELALTPVPSAVATAPAYLFP